MRRRGVIWQAFRYPEHERRRSPACPPGCSIARTTVMPSVRTSSTSSRRPWGGAMSSSATCPRTSHPRGVSLAPMTITNLRRRAGPYQRKYSLVCDKITLLQRRVRKIFDGLEAFHKMRVTVIPTYVFADPAGGQSPTRMCVRAIAWSAMNHERMVNDYIPRLDVPSEEIVKLGPVANILQIPARRGR